MAIKYGLTANGFISPTFEEILDSIEADFRTRFGDDIVLTSNSMFGIIARLMAWRERDTWNQLQEVYYSSFINTGTETALDRQGANTGVTRKVEEPSYGVIKVVTDGEYEVQAGEVFSTEDGIEFVLLNSIYTKQNSDGTWSGQGAVQSQDKGEFSNVKANTVTVVSNPDMNIISVTNPDPIGGGQDTESDEEFRDRLIDENTAKPGPTRNGIKSALRNLPGVKQVGIVDNPNNEADKYGNPPNSVHIYVLGGNDEQIAETIGSHIAVGVKLTGSRIISYTDEDGLQRSVPFDYAKERDIFVNVEIKTDSDFNEDSGKDEIMQNIQDYINSLQMGDSIILTKLYPCVYDIDGIYEASISIASRVPGDTTPLEYKQEDIILDSYEAPICPDGGETEEQGVKVVVK